MSVSELGTSKMFRDEQDSENYSFYLYNISENNLVSKLKKKITKGVYITRKQKQSSEIKMTRRI